MILAYPKDARTRHRHRRMRRLIERMSSRGLSDGAVVELPVVSGCEGFPRSYVLSKVGPIVHKEFQPPAAYELHKSSIEHADGIQIVATASGVGRWIRVS